MNSLRIFVSRNADTAQVVEDLEAIGIKDVLAKHGGGKIVKEETIRVPAAAPQLTDDGVNPGRESI